MSDLVAHSRPGVVGEPWARQLRRSAANYLALTKPRVIELLLVTTLPAMILAAGAFPSIGLVAAVLVGGALSAGGANTINCWVERDRDQLMRRTRHRPLPAGTVDPARALVFGLVLEVLAVALLWSVANLLAAALALTAAAFYILVYTVWLKPRTVQNIVIGGAAGAVPVLVGWAAVTGSLSAAAWVLFAVVFFWTPAHFWALATRFSDDYASAGIPMLPVVRGPVAAATQILVYTVIVVAVSLTLPAVASVGAIYLGVAAAAGLVFVVRAVRLRLDPTGERAIAFFTLSNLYLTVLFAAVAVDVLVRAH